MLLFWWYNADRDFDFDKFLLDEKLYKKEYENTLI